MYKNSSKPFLSVTEAAEFLDLSKASVYRLVHTGRLKSYKPFGKKLYFSEDALTSCITKDGFSN